LFAARIGTVRQGNSFSLVSREGALVVNNLLLSVILGIVLIGTLYPLAAAGWGVQLSVVKPFFDKTAGPIALLLVVFMAMGPLLRWRRDEPQALLKRLTWPVAAAGVALIVLVSFASEAGLMPLLALVLAAGLAVASVAPLWGRNLRRTPLFTWGMVVAHLGVAVSLAGMASDSAFTKETLAVLRQGETRAVGPYLVTMTGIRPVIGPNWSAIAADLSIRRGEGATPFILSPQSRFFASPPTTTSESAIATRLDGQLYTVLGQADGKGGWQVRLWWKPFVTLIWLGGALIGLGGALSFFGRIRRRKRAVYDDYEEAAA
jgi:cytochrome c-type biogenesis protein CcmF